MTVFARLPIWVEGVRLDTFAYAWESRSSFHGTAGKSGTNVSIAMRPGELGTANKTLDASEVSLSMWVRGTDVNGVAPASIADRQALMLSNLSKLQRLFLMGNFYNSTGLITVAKAVTKSTTGSATEQNVVRQAQCEVVAALKPSIDTSGGSPTARFDVILRVLEGLWQDPNDITTGPRTLETGLGTANITKDLVVSFPEFAASEHALWDLEIILKGPMVVPTLWNIYAEGVQFPTVSLTDTQYLRFSPRRYMACRSTVNDFIPPDAVETPAGDVDIFPNVNLYGTQKFSSLYTLPTYFHAEDPYKEAMMRIVYRTTTSIVLPSVNVRGRRRYLS